jgi:phosphoribosyl-AMP cyclohydrolase / phosphoribosyl-ATP pyrophosphohydrolase
MIDIDKLNFSKLDNLIPAVIIDYTADKVLMLGFMNKEALLNTLETGKVTFYSRTKKRLWVKGETSGNFLLVKSILPDCDYDSIIVYVEPAGPTCHTGDYSCFKLKKNNLNFLMKLDELIHERKSSLQKHSYTSGLFSQGADRIIQKVGEEATEVIIAAKNNSKNEIIYESADLIYHLIVLLTEYGLSISDVVQELESRNKDK